MLTTRSEANALRAAAAATGAIACHEAATAMFEAGGKELIHEAGQKLLREGAEQACKRVLETSAPQVLAKAAEEAAKQIGSTAAKEVATSTATQAATQVTTTVAREAVELTAKQVTGQVLKSVGGAMGIGAVVDGAFASAEAAHGLWTGKMGAGDAAIHVVKESATGAAATGVGVAAGIALVALTGPVSVPLLIVISGGTSLAAKFGLKSLFG